LQWIVRAVQRIKRRSVLRSLFTEYLSRKLGSRVENGGRWKWGQLVDDAQGT
jgi:hypothetical protein